MSSKNTLIIGSYSNQLGIISKNDLNTGTPITTLPLNPAPSWLHYDQKNSILYAVEEDHKPKLFIYKWDNHKTPPTLLHSFDTGAAPCHISLTKNLLNHTQPSFWVSNYNGGNFSVFTPTGKIFDFKNFSEMNILSLPQDLLSSPHSSNLAMGFTELYREKIASKTPSHPHCTIVTPNKKGVFATDLGLDFIYYFEFCDNEIGVQLKSVTETPKGFGPRHLTITKLANVNYSVLYVNCELIPFIMSYKINTNNTLTLIERYPVYGETQNPLIPPKQITAGSEIATHRTLPIIYHANRSLDTAVKPKGDITVYEIKSDHTLAIKEVFTLTGDYPRHFTIEPSGEKLLVAMQKSDVIEVLHIKKSGKLSFSHTLPYPKPSFLQFI